MNNNHSIFANQFKSPILYISYILAALFIMSLIQSPGLINPRAGVTNMVDFTAHKPFVYRALVPIFIRMVEFITPKFIKESLNARFADYLARHGDTTLSKVAVDKINTVSKSGARVVIFMIINLAFLVAFLFSLSKLAKLINLFSDGICQIAPLGMIFILPFYFNYGNFLYDFAVLFFFTTGLILLYQRKWLIYLIVFALAILNKETAALLTIVYAVYYFQKLPRSQYLQLLGIQLAILIVIKIILMSFFISNQGSGFEWHTERNLSVLVSIPTYFNFTPVGIVPLFPSGLNILLPRGFNIPLFAIIAFLVFYGWQQKPRLLRIALIIIPAFLVVGFFTCLIDELRSYYEALPVVYLLGLSGLAIFAKRIIKSKSGSTAARN
jgi:hypothetical protein